MKKQIVGLLFVCSLLFPFPAFASKSISIISDKGSLFGNEEMNVSASLSGFTTGEKIYVKGAFFKEGSTNYFGFTKNGDNWIKNNTTATDQRQVEIGNWDGGLTVRSDFDDSGYSGTGDYKFKLGFYYTTSGGNLSSVNWSNNILSLALDSPAPTTAPTQNSTQTTSPTTRTSSATKTLIPTKSGSSSNIASSPISSNKQTSSNFAKIPENFKIGSDFARIRNVSPTNKSLSKTEVLGAKTSKPILEILTILAGLILFLGASLYFIYRNWELIKLWMKRE